MSRLLINENPLQVLPTLAVKIGLNEAMILQQMHYWLNAYHNKNYIQGRHWVYNSYEEWHKQFPFWSKETIKRAIYSLEKQKLVLSEKLSEEKFNHRKWYSINYEELERLDQVNERSGQFVTNGEVTNETLDQVKMTQTDGSLSYKHNKEQRLQPEITTKTSSSKGDEEKKLAIKMKEIWIEEIGEVEVTQLTESLILSMILSYQTIFNNSLESWRFYCRKIASSKFLMGEGGKGFKVWLTWAIKPDTYYKIEAGEYTLGDREVISQDISKEIKEEEIREIINNSGKHPLWIAVCHHMIERVGALLVKQWLLEMDIKSHNDKEIFIHSNSLFVRDWVRKNLYDQIKKALEQVLGHTVHHFLIDVYEINSFGASLPPETEEEGKTSPTQPSSSNLFNKEDVFSASNREKQLVSQSLSLTLPSDAKDIGFFYKRDKINNSDFKGCEQ